MANRRQEDGLISAGTGDFLHHRSHDIIAGAAETGAGAVDPRALPPGTRHGFLRVDAGSYFRTVRG